LSYASEERNSASEKAGELALEAEKAVAAAETGNEVTIELRKSLDACHKMGDRLRSISTDNIRELVIVRDQRDSSLLDLARSTRDLAATNQALSHLKTALTKMTKERNRSRASLMAMTDERDAALQEQANTVLKWMNKNQLFQAEYRRAEEHLQPARIFSDAVGPHLKSQENLKKKIQDLTTARDRSQAIAQAPPVIPTQNRAPSLTPPDAAAYRDPAPSDQLSSGSEHPDSPTLFVNNTPILLEFSPSSILAVATRKSTRSTRNPAPNYDGPPTSNVPKHNRKRKAASTESEGPAKRKP
jgi:hypothetical protein